MTAPFHDGGVQSVYDFWLGLIPMFFGQLGVDLSAGGKAAPSDVPGAAAPAGQHAGPASTTPELLQNFARAYAPMMKAADPSSWLGPWTTAMPFFPGASAKPPDGAAAPSAGPTMFGPWAAMLASFSGGQAKPDPAAMLSSGAMGMGGPWMAESPFIPGAQGSSDSAGRGGAAAGMQSFQQAQQAWLDAVARFGGASPQSYITAFDRTFGGLFDALGFGPIRKLQAAFQDLAAASLAQNDSRTNYGVLVQAAFASGFERLMTRLAKMADSGERVESVLALLRLWAVSTEEVVHEVLQSERGLAATAALARTGVTYRRKLQHVAGIVADALDMATRRELDEAYREIHDLKREVRALRPPALPRLAVSSKPRGRTDKRKSK